MPQPITPSVCAPTRFDTPRPAKIPSETGAAVLEGGRNMDTVGRALAIATSLLAGFGLAAPAYAADYYVSGSSGNDDNPGTLESPWQTIQKANATLQAGDTVYIRGGTYDITGSAV